MTFREIRKMSGFTQQEFAEQYNISIDAVKSWESDPESKRYRKCPDATLLLLEMAVRKFKVHGKYRTYFNEETHKILYTDKDMIYPYTVISEDMAYAMRVLSEKGYTVSGACAGAWNYEFEGLNGDDAPAVVEWPGISFEEGIHLPSIPEGWELEEDDCEYDEDENEVKGYWASLTIADHKANTEYEFTQKKLQAILKLNEWAYAL